MLMSTWTDGNELLLARFRQKQNRFTTRTGRSLDLAQLWLEISGLIIRPFP
jgi:hypothetical protein